MLRAEEFPGAIDGDLFKLPEGSSTAGQVKFSDAISSICLRWRWTSASKERDSGIDGVEAKARKLQEVLPRRARPDIRCSQTSGYQMIWYARGLCNGWSVWWVRYSQLRAESALSLPW